MMYFAGHGIGQVESRETKDFNGNLLEFLNAKILSNGLKISFPLNNKKPKNRELLNEKQIKKLYKFLQDRDYKADNSTWNRRHREYMNKIKSLDVTEVASILRDLLVLEKTKKLSFGERKMKEQVLDLLSDEIYFVTKEDKNLLKERLTK